MSDVVSENRPYIIELKNIHKRFGKQKVLNGVNLNIPKGCITVIIGQSGQGKSVILKVIMGLIEADSGEILISGKNPKKLGRRGQEEVRKRFGMLFQGAALFDSMNVEDNVAFPLREHTKLPEPEIKRKVQEMLDQVKLPKIHKKMPSELSGGMRKRVGLARALIMEPEVMLYDEPTTGLDPILTDSVDNLIMETQQRHNITSIVVSHDLKGIFKIGDHIAMLNDGKILEEGSPSEFRNSKKSFVQKFIIGKADENFIG